MHGVKNKTSIVLVPYYSDVKPKVRRLLDQLRVKGYEVWDAPGMSAIDQARNQMAQVALNNGYKDIYFLDADVLADVSAFTKIRRHDLPICAGIYCSKDGTGRPCVDEAEYTDLTKPLTQVRYAATGFLYIKAEVFRTISKNLNLEQCSARFGPCHPWFLPMVKRNRYLGEDYAFCDRANESGYKIMADTTIELQHIGDYGYKWPGVYRAGDKGRIPLIFSVIDNPRLLPEFVRHYLNQGVTNFYACVHPKLGNRIAEVDHIMRQVGGQIEVMPDQEFNGQFDSQFQDSIRSKYVLPEEWYVVADIDEFHMVPNMRLASAIQHATEDGAEVIAGEFRDRVTATGVLPPDISDILPLSIQFPCTAKVTQVITRGHAGKVLCARGHIPIESGHHRYKGIAWHGRGWADHYKWWGPLREKAQARAVSYETQGLFWSDESRRLLAHLDAHDGKLNLDFPGLTPRYVQNH